MKHSIHLVIAEFQSHYGIQVVEVLKLKVEQCPMVFIIDSRKEEIQLYRLNKLKKNLFQQKTVLMNLMMKWKKLKLYSWIKKLK